MFLNYLLLLFFGLGLSDVSFSQGINFSHDSTLAQIKIKARKENKPIFIDCYTTWCGPCKWMNKNVFTTDTAGTFYNANFICAKIDMEKGDGLNIASKYRVRSYPTFLFLDTTGKEIHRFLGSQFANKFVENGKNAINDDHQLSTLKQKYKNGERSNAFIQIYLRACEQAGEDVKEVFDWYITSLKNEDYILKEHAQILMMFPNYSTSTIFDKIYSHKEWYISQFGSSEFSNYIMNFFNKELSACFVKDRVPSNSGEVNFIIDEDKYLAFTNKLNSTDFKGKAEFLNEVKYNYLNNKNDVAGLIDFLNKNATKNPNQLNSVAWMAYEKSTDKKELKEALALSKKSIEMDNSYSFNDTYASLFYKLGMKKEAKKFAEIAIGLAKQNNEDYSATSELLEKIMLLK